MPQMTFAVDVELIMIIVSGFAIVISAWAIVYFGGRIALDAYQKSRIGDMPSEEEIAAHYAELNARLLGIVDGLYIQDIPTSEQSHDNPES